MPCLWGRRPRRGRNTCPRRGGRSGRVSADRTSRRGGCERSGSRTRSSIRKTIRKGRDGGKGRSVRSKRRSGQGGAGGGRPTAAKQRLCGQATGEVVLVAPGVRSPRRRNGRTARRCTPEVWRAPGLAAGEGSRPGDPGGSQHGRRVGVLRSSSRPAFQEDRGGRSARGSARTLQGENVQPHRRVPRLRRQGQALRRDPGQVVQERVSVSDAGRDRDGAG